jgi:sugar/nucleoside kinase (ribokinase family)
MQRIAQPERPLQREILRPSLVGAGDTFIGAFAVALQEGLDTDGAAAFAQRAAALSVTRAGAMASVPTRAELEGEALR